MRKKNLIEAPRLRGGRDIFDPNIISMLLANPEVELRELRERDLFFKKLSCCDSAVMAMCLQDIESR